MGQFKKAPFVKSSGHFIFREPKYKTESTKLTYAVYHVNMNPFVVIKFIFLAAIWQTYKEFAAAGISVYL